MSVEQHLPTTTPRWFGLALQSLMFLALNESKCPSGEIAGHVCSEATLMRRILSRLARANIVQAREGRDGGYYLVKKPDEITLAEVYRAIRIAEPLYSGMLETIMDGPFKEEMHKAFSDIIKESEARILEVLERQTIAGLVQKVYQEGKR